MNLAACNVPGIAVHAKKSTNIIVGAIVTKVCFFSGLGGLQGRAGAVVSGAGAL